MDGDEINGEGRFTMVKSLLSYKIDKKDRFHRKSATIILIPDEITLKSADLT